MLKELIEKQQLYLSHFFETLNLQPIEQLIKLILECKGMIFFTGIGKSGLVAKKIAFTMVSTGTHALYLSPVDALHGDLGIVSDKDVFIMLSKSGESDELLNLIPAIRNKGATLVGVVCNPQSRLSAACHLVVTLPFEHELCPFDMAPTMSTSFQLLFGDLLTVALMHHKNFSLDQYALNHPSGRIGKRMLLKVKDLMIKDPYVPLCSPDDLLRDILVELSDKRCGCILIIDKEHHLLGIFTDGDLRRTLQKQGGDVLQSPMREIMTVKPKWIGRDVLIWESMKQMEANYQKRISVLPVLDDDLHVLGLLHLHDVIQTGL
jgi:arabinose-5-phosphate isomerase